MSDKTGMLTIRKKKVLFWLNYYTSYLIHKIIHKLIHYTIQLHTLS